MSAYLRMLADRVLGRPSPIQPPRPARLLPLGTVPTDPAAEPVAFPAHPPPFDTTSRKQSGEPLQPAPPAMPAHEADTSPADALPGFDGTELPVFPEGPNRSPALPPSANTRAQPDNRDIHDAALHAASPRPERSTAPATQIRSRSPASENLPARDDRPYPAVTELDAPPETASSTYIHIGRVELHATPPSPLPRHTSKRPTHQPMSLEEYLRRREGKPR